MDRKLRDKSLIQATLGILNGMALPSHLEEARAVFGSETKSGETVRKWRKGESRTLLATTRPDVERFLREHGIDPSTLVYGRGMTHAGRVREGRATYGADERIRLYEARAADRRARSLERLTRAVEKDATTAELWARARATPPASDTAPDDGDDLKRSGPLDPPGESNE